ncbi:MAG: sulfotransferase [Microcoleaceae cyanobacterium]
MNLPQFQAKSSIFAITGMHRSGTSLVTGILQSAGLHVGQELIEANEWNAKGYFENVEFVEFHKDVLGSQKISEDGWTLQENIGVEEQHRDQAEQIVAEHSMFSLWGWKDPRTTLFLNFWANLLPEANFLLIYRAPWEVVDSLYRRADEPFQKEPELAVKLWLHYNQKITELCNQFPQRCLLTNISAVVKSPQKYVDKINQQFGTYLTAPAEDFYDVSLFGIDEKDGYRPSLIECYFPDAIGLYEELEARSWKPGDKLDMSWRDRIRSSPYKVWVFQDWMALRQVETLYQSLQEKYQTSESDRVILKSQIQQLESQRHKAELKLHETETVLEQSQLQLNETETTLEQCRNQLKQTQAQVDQFYSEVQQQQMQSHLVQEELEQALSQLYQAESLLEGYHKQFKQAQSELERLKFEQALSERSDNIYQSLVSRAWLAYKNQDLTKMAQSLQQSVQYWPGFQSEILLNWLESFAQLSAQYEESFNVQTLIQSIEWQQLMRRIMTCTPSVKQQFVEVSSNQNGKLTAIREKLSQSKAKLAQVEADLNSF